MNVRVVDVKAQQRASDVPTCVARRAGIQMNQVQFRISHHFEDVGVAADKQAGMLFEDLSASVFFVVSGIASNMSDVDAKTLAFKVQI